ncbi:hypothetical protein NC652_024527 [Populus alba x Populus x berolinensis]|nr:hypothetical protein NC652_024527 [Populus alba x Populus x berolinensis]
MSCQTTDRRPRDALNLDCLSILRWRSIGYAGHQQEVAGDIESSDESKARHEFLDETVKTRTSSSSALVESRTQDLPLTKRVL